jgi:hypothetical protein
MAKVGVSLCILAHNRIAETANLIGSLRGFADIELEICIVDQESDSKARSFAFQTADNFSEISDRDLWDRGFGWAKQQAVKLASNSWVIIGDPGEIWHETTANGEFRRLAEAIRLENSVPAFRVYYGNTKNVIKLIEGQGSVASMYGEVCRVFDKRKMRMLGYIHEAPVHKETGVMWSNWARRFKPVAVIEENHVLSAVPLLERCGSLSKYETYEKRKQLLYDHLLHKIVMEPKLRSGTDFRWWTAHWNTVVAPRFKEISFEEWKAVGG